MTDQRRLKNLLPGEHYLDRTVIRLQRQGDGNGFGFKTALPPESSAHLSADDADTIEA